MENSNSVVLIDYMGSDNTHAINAWASTFLELGVELPEDVKSRTDILTDAILNKGGRKRDVPGLLKFLAEHGHTSPFRSSKFLFGMNIELASHVQLLTHTVAIEHTNAESARYKELKEDKFYLPDDWLDYGEAGKFWYQKLKADTEYRNKCYHAALDDLTAAGMPRDRAKETARFFKTYNSQINVMRSLNFDGLVQIWQKRGKHTKAQREVAGIAEAMVQAVRDIPGNPFKYSLEAFGL
jgi:thymidylate synthase ThyX